VGTSEQTFDRVGKNIPRLLSPDNHLGIEKYICMTLQEGSWEKPRDRVKDYSRKNVKPYRNVEAIKPTKRTPRFSNSAGEGGPPWEVIIRSEAQIDGWKENECRKQKSHFDGAYNGPWSQLIPYSSAKYGRQGSISSIKRSTGLNTLCNIAGDTTTVSIGCASKFILKPKYLTPRLCRSNSQL